MKAPTQQEAFELRKAIAQEAMAALRAADCVGYVAPVSEDIKPEALKARQRFDLEVELARAGIDYPPTGRPQTARGAAGVRLRAHLEADISDALLREFACETLRAERCSAKYLRALRIVLGNLADAEQKGYTLELNLRGPCAPERVMRTIIDQMQAAELTYGAAVALGEGRRQVVQCFVASESAPYLSEHTKDSTADRWLGWIDRGHEEIADARRLRFVGPMPSAVPSKITGADVPH